MKIMFQTYQPKTNFKGITKAPVPESKHDEVDLTITRNERSSAICDRCSLNPIRNLTIESGSTISGIWPETITAQEARIGDDVTLGVQLMVRHMKAGKNFDGYILDVLDEAQIDSVKNLKLLSFRREGTKRLILGDTNALANLEGKIKVMLNPGATLQILTKEGSQSILDKFVFMVADGGIGLRSMAKDEIAKAIQVIKRVL